MCAHRRCNTYREKDLVRNSIPVRIPWGFFVLDFSSECKFTFSLPFQLWRYCVTQHTCLPYCTHLWGIHVSLPSKWYRAKNKDKIDKLHFNPIRSLNMEGSFKWLLGVQELWVFQCTWHKVLMVYKMHKQWQVHLKREGGCLNKNICSS